MSTNKPAMFFPRQLSARSPPESRTVLTGRREVIYFPRRSENDGHGCRGCNRVSSNRMDICFNMARRTGSSRKSRRVYRPLYRDIAEIELIGVECALQSFSPSRPGIDTSPIPRLPIINLLDTPNLLASPSNRFAF